MGHIKDFYERIFNISDKEWAYISSFFERKVYHKGEIITAYGEVEEHLFFIESGMLRFFIPNEDPELTFNFSFEKQFTCAYDSFLSRNPSLYSLEALGEMVVWQISHENLQKVYAHTAAGHYLGRFVAEQMYLDKSKRELSLLKYNATERYLKLFDEQPQIIHQIPLKYVACYIGITPQALSRIRRQIN
ncbi:CarD family transcriptional regulator [Myroides marinus]|uniref:Crp/Fnr family transcriptional regulator n=1 Tax=Myroides marinus TaxID=703342 RepID=UPI0007420252|nr:Crp/Fnr family transcriptional regulator [Myroides marinus]KUF44904.1 CarD family transcriptional regulator [Myroides marinus]